MTRLIAVLFAALVGLTLICDQADAAPGRWKTTTPRAIPQSPGPYESWPDIATTRENCLVLAHSSGDRHVATRRDAVIRLSCDGGKTWRVTKRFHSSTGDRLWAPEGITRLADGTLLLMVSRLRAHDDINYVQFWRSRDGRTWSKVGTDRDWESPVTFGNITQLSDGTLLIPWHGKGWGFVRCNGTAVKCTISGYSNGGPMAAEARVFRVTGTRLIMTGRNRDPERGLLLFRSADNGRHWTRGVSTGLGVRTEGGAAKGDRLLMVLADRTSGKVTLRDSSLAALYQNPRAWGAARHVFTLPDSPAADRGYPVITRDRTVGYAGAIYGGPKGRPSIRVFRLSK